MARIEYEDFEIKIQPKRDDVYPVIVLRSPAGEGSGEFHLPFAEDEISKVFSQVGWAVRGARAALAQEVSAAEEAMTLPRLIGTLQEFGGKVFQALFSGRVRNLYDISLGMVSAQRHKGLRIKLHLDPEVPELANLASLPWEYLYQQDTRDFLNLSRRTPVVRYLDVPRPVAPLTVKPPLWVLVVISAPTNYPPLDLEKEKGLIKEALGERDDVEVQFLETATISALEQALSEGDFHILHFMGHGGFHEQTGQGVLLLEDEAGKGQEVSGENIGLLLDDSTVRLVFLNACETARVAEEEGRDPFAGVATALVMEGLPAVVAMQFPVSDTAAIVFSREIYTSLAKGYPIDEAVTRGRRAIKFIEPGSVEWGTPVLFMRARDGVIFNVVEEPEERPPEEVKEEVVPRPQPMPAWVWLVGVALVIGLLVVGGVVVMGGRFFGPQVTPAPTVAVAATGTLSPTPSPSPSPSPTEAVLTCKTEPIEPFAAIWHDDRLLRQRLRCPIAPGRTVMMAEQFFEGGLMYWVEDVRRIYVLNSRERTWDIFQDTFVEGVDPEWVGLSPPPGLLEPKRGFGKVWREELGGADSAIGWA
ncbi:MAG: CHAT domain-containing protein, partial [Anaerolineae bacterium]